MDLYPKLRSVLAEPLKRRALHSPLVVKLVRQIISAQKRAFPWEASHRLALKAIDQAADAFLRRGPVVWHNVFFPSELLYGLGVVPFAPEAAAAVAVGLGLVDEAFRAADGRWFGSDGCSFHRLALGCELAGYFPRPDAVVCTSHLCDIAPQSLALTAARHERPFHLVDVPRRAGVSEAHYVARQLKGIFFSLAEELGLKPDMARLEAALRRSNEAREGLLRVSRLRREAPAVIRGEEAHGFLYLMLTSFGSPWAAGVYDKWYEELRYRREQGDWAVPREKVRLLWLHLRPYYANDIFKILEREGGAVVVFEEMNHVYWEELDPRHPFFSLARKVLSHHGLGPLERRIGALMQMVEDFRTQGVVHFAHWGCRQSTAGVALLQQALREQGIAFLNLDGDCVDRQKYAPGAVRTRLEGFLELLT
ncbi:2-hydroxyacyl-CoA dehydratase subunit D [Thermanaeromonas sp. C210]|uniref:2-hydroxyacyl-CoA dehydratase subunit D n=1 Tax=Thermanaeromonas sp. C210 TaxID=2731925 RepID=UPI00155CC43B|nr:2-hydroxyacyl-CoA dehydratase family protein [Thermanaeromonas sp. C210]GFN21896.1 2-hydroxyglutaryl-CoA dehydratase [Thermanaeromonas sp. C210]